MLGVRTGQDSHQLVLNIENALTGEYRPEQIAKRMQMIFCKTNGAWRRIICGGKTEGVRMDAGGLETRNSIAPPQPLDEGFRDRTNLRLVILSLPRSTSPLHLDLTFPTNVLPNYSRSIEHLWSWSSVSSEEPQLG